MAKLGQLINGGCKSLVTINQLFINRQQIASKARVEFDEYLILSCKEDRERDFKSSW